MDMGPANPVGMVGAIFLAGLAWGGTRPTRAPLPARWVERPILVPRGWTEIAAGAGGWPVDAAGSQGEWIDLRYGVGRRLDLGVGAVDPFGDGTVRGMVRVGLFAAEPPQTAVALEAGWTTARSGLAWGGDLGAAVRRESGPIQLDATVRYGWTRGPEASGMVGGWTGSLRGALQVGPVAPRIALGVRGAGVGTTTVDLLVQASRGLRASAGWCGSSDPAIGGQWTTTVGVAL
jgi:hypothetical protein